MTVEAATFVKRLRAHARDRPAHPAAIDEAAPLGYAQLLARVEAEAARLVGDGVGPGAVVGITLDNEINHLVATLAVAATGASQIVLATHDPPPLRDRIARRVGVTHVLAASGLATTGAVRSAADRGVATYYLKTSGTTAEVNLVAFDEAQIAAQAARHADYRDERLLRLASIEHNNSRRHRLYCVWAGGTNVFAQPGPDLVACVGRLGVTCLDVSRLHAADLASGDGAQGLSAIKLRTGGSSVPIAIRRAIIERVSAHLHVRYAATECGAIAMALPGEHDDDETVGLPLSGVEVQVVGSDGPLAAGESGEIRVRAPGMALGYVDNPTQTAERFRDGWFHPGDVGYLRADGRLVVQARADDMIILNGLNIFPAEIERALEAHPAVAEAAAFAIGSRVHGQIPVAMVRLEAGASALPAELQRYARERLGLRTPRRIVVVEELPRNAQGKLSRHSLAASMAAAV